MRKRIAALVATAHGDEIVSKGSTRFLMTVSTSDMGKALPNYLSHVLEVKSASVVFSDDGYGRTFAANFQSVAEGGELKTAYHKIRASRNRDEDAQRAEREQREAIVLSLASNPEQPAVALGMTQDAAAPILVMLRRKGYKGPVLGTTTMARTSFPDRFKNEAEEEGAPGFYTDGIYAAPPVMLDSANAETLAFARRFRERHGHEPSGRPSNRTTPRSSLRRRSGLLAPGMRLNFHQRRREAS
jgi:ABC-type branched-subunit amino acid transport system substrate-binding protein